METASQPSLTEPSILYVDDQPSHRALFQKAFPDYPILVASSGEEGLEILQGQRIFLALADHQMPRMSGIDFLARVRELVPSAMRAILSAYDDPKLVSDAQQRAQVSEYLRKPWKRDQIRSFLERARQFYQDSFEPTDQTLTLPAIDWQRVCHLFDSIGNHLDKRSAKRVYLSYVEPPLRKVVAPIHRPIHEALRFAEECALQGNVVEMEKNLVTFLRETENGQQVLDSILKFLPTKH